MSPDRIHYEACEAPLCAVDIEPEFADVRIWYPGEPVCGKRSYLRFQKVQAKINRKVENGKFKYGDTYYFTRPMLEKLTRVTNTLRGLDPDKPQAQQMLGVRYTSRYAKTQT